jgi:hypothetical protein
MNTFHPKHFIHVDPERVDFSVSEHELQLLTSSANNSWKDFCIACLGVGIPCAINAISELSAQQTFAITKGMFLNSLFGTVGVALGIIFAIAWYRTKTSVATLVQSIRDKPKMEMPVTMTDIGQLEAPQQQPPEQ